MGTRTDATLSGPRPPCLTAPRTSLHTFAQGYCLADGIRSRHSAGVYTRELELDDDTLEPLLRASLYLGVAEVQQAICEYLTSRLSVETCLVRPFAPRTLTVETHTHLAGPRACG